MKSWLINRIASAIHAAYREEKLASGHPVEHTVNGRPFDLRHRWHELCEEHRQFDERIARRLLAGMLNWFG